MRWTAALAAVWVCTLAGSAAAADRLFLKAQKPGALRATPMQPFTLDLIVERGESATQMSAVAYTLDVPDDVVLVGEELLVGSLLGLGSSLDGMNFVFECTSTTPLPVLRFRFVTTRPVHDAVIALRPERLTNFLGFVSCREEDFAKFSTAADSVIVNAR